MLSTIVVVFETPWTIACQDPLSMGFPRQEYQNRLHFHLQEIFPIQGLNLQCPALADRFLTTEQSGKPMLSTRYIQINRTSKI